MSLKNADTPGYITARVQYLDDTDPFSSTNFPEPTRPPSYTFSVHIPIAECLAGVHRLLMAPHRLHDCTLQLSHTHSYLGTDYKKKVKLEHQNAVLPELIILFYDKTF